MINDMIEWLEEDCELTLRQIQSKLMEHHRICVRSASIGNALDLRSFTTKKTHHMPSAMNSDANKRLRREYLIKLNQYIRDGKDIIWMDESNVNLFCRRTVGRSRRGTRAVSSLPASRGPMSICWEQYHLRG